MAEFDSMELAVLSVPNEDSPRFAFAEACDRSEDPAWRARGEFIRLQLTLAATEPRLIHNGKMYHERRRELDLLGLYGAQWAAPLAGLVTGFQFDRGFVELVTLSARRFLEVAEELYRLAPVRHLNLTGAKDLMAELAASPALRPIRSLSLERARLTDADVELLAQSQHVEGLRWLCLADNELRLGAAEALAASSGLPSLVYADFTGNYVDPCEQGGDDSGVIVAKWLTPAGMEIESRYGFRAWLHRAGETRETFHADRFRV